MAAEILEELPGAILSWQAPEDYEGGYPAYVEDAERLFRSVARRLRLVDRI